MKDLINLTCNYFVHSFILFTFLTLLFIFYISKVAENAFSSEIKHLITTAFSTLNINLDHLPFDIPKNINLNFLSETYSKPDQTSSNFNKLLMKSLVVVNLLLWIGLIIIMSILKFYNYKTLEITTIIFENLLIFLFIGIIEYLFFTKIAVKYIPVKPSFMKSKFVELLKAI